MQSSIKTSGARLQWDRAKSWLETAISFLYPEVCQICGEERATSVDGYIGAKCWKHVQFITPPYCGRCGLPYSGDLTNPFTCANCQEFDFAFSHARSAVAARGMLLEVIHKYKYSHALWFEPFLADLLVRAAAPALRQEGWDMIIPVPLHPAKERQREFNQAQRLGRHLAEACQLPLDGGCLRRRVPTDTQTRLSRSERAKNMRGAFEVKQPHAVKGRRVVLVDDVFTTGATADACARALRQQGASEICVWTLARGLLH